MKKIYICILAVIMFFSLVSCSNVSKAELLKAAELTENALDVQAPTATPTPEPPKKIIIAAVGDIMFHSPQITNAFNGSTYDFTESFEDVKVVLESADTAIGNFETTIHPTKKPSGYPRFNAPVEVLDAIKGAGFDVLVTANNHCADTGADGIANTVEMIKKRGMQSVGTSTPDNLKYTIIESNTIRVGILAYTSSTNGLPAPEGMVNMTDLEAIKKDIEIIKPQCDFIIVYVHTGTEYVRDIEKDQQNLFRAIADAGADCVLGSHPHVARQSELYKTAGREVYINYSLGNFLSNQNDKYTDIGGMVQLSIIKDENSTSLKDFEILPIYRLRYKAGSKVVVKAILGSEMENYDNINSDNQSYIKTVSEEITKLYRE